MAVAFGSISNTTYASRTNTTVTAPTGIANGDVLIAHILWSGNGTSLTPPSGWSQVGTTMTAIEAGFAFYLNSAIFKKVAASESGNYTWTHSSASTQGKISRYTGSSGTINAFSSDWHGGTQDTPGNANCVAASITTTVNNCMIVYEGFDWGDTTNALSPPTGYTERLEVNPLIYSADIIQAGTGATGSVSHVANVNNTNPRGAWLLALEPAASGQTITGAIYTDTDTFNGATVAATYGIAGALLSDGDTFYGATIGRGAVNIAGSLVSDGDTFYASVVNNGNGIVGSLYTDPDTIYGAAILATNAITAAIYTDTDTIRFAALSATYTISAGLHVDVDTFYAATLTGGAQPGNLSLSRRYLWRRRR